MLRYEWHGLLRYEWHTLADMAGTVCSDICNSLGFIMDQGKFSPFPIIATDYDNSLYYNFHPKIKEIQKSKQRNTKYLLDDWDSEETLFCYINQPSKEYEIAFYDEVGEWSKVIESTGELDIHELSKKGNNLFVSGYYLGQLYYDGSFVDQGLTGKMFFATIDKNGSLLQLNFINSAPDRNNIKFNKEPKDGQIIIAGEFAQGQVNLGGNVSSMSSQNGVFISTFDKGGNQFSLETTIHGQDNIDILGVSRDSLTGAISLALRIVANSSTLYINNHPVNIIANDDRVYIFSLNGSQLDWSYSLPTDNIDLENFNLAIGKERSIFIAFPFHNTIQLPEGNLQSAGDSDIAILKINGNTQEVEFSKTFGTEDNETVTKIFYSVETESLFFGGEYEGSTEERTIGNYRFINLGLPDSSKVYFSYIKDAVQGARPVIRDLNFANKKLDESFSVSPNPFEDEIQMKILTKKSIKGKVTVSNLLGREVFSEKLRLVEGTNTITLSLGNKLLSGIYVLNCYLGGELIGQRKIICTKN